MVVKMHVCPPLLKSDLPTPKVLWYQTDINVTLRIILAGVDDYFLFVDEDHLRFSTSVKGRPYYLCLYLFGAIVPEECKHRNVGSEIRITLPKGHKWIPWLRLCLKKENNPHIITDPDRIEDNTILLRRVVQREWDDWQEYKRRNNIVNILPACHSSEESESDDEMMDALIDESDLY